MVHLNASEGWPAFWPAFWPIKQLLKKTGIKNKGIQSEHLNSLLQEWCRSENEKVITANETKSKKTVKAAEMIVTIVVFVLNTFESALALPLRE